MASRNKQTEINPPPKLQGGVAIGGVALDAEFVYCYKHSMVDLQIVCIRRHVTLVYSIYPPLFAFQPEQSRSELSADLTGMSVEGGGEHCFVYFGKPFMNVRVQSIFLHVFVSRLVLRSIQPPIK